MAKKPTIATVAAQAGVAVSTVSRYLNGHYVSAPVQARLSEVIASLGYSRSWTARNLSLGRRGCIGVVVDSSADPWFVQLLTGIEEELSTRDMGLMLSSLELRGLYDPSLVFSWIRDRRVDGLVIAKSQRRERALLKAAVEAQLPTVIIAPDEISTDVQVVRCNNIAAGGRGRRAPREPRSSQDRVRRRPRALDRFQAPAPRAARRARQARHSDRVQETCSSAAVTRARRAASSRRNFSNRRPI